jgi:hypothetical protein
MEKGEPEAPTRTTLNQTRLTGNAVSNQTSKPGNQFDYEPGQLASEANRAEGHVGNRGLEGGSL